MTGDNEFSPLEEQLVNLPGAPRLNLTSAGEHEPFVEKKTGLSRKESDVFDTPFLLKEFL